MARETLLTCSVANGRVSTASLSHGLPPSNPTKELESAKSALKGGRLQRIWLSGLRRENFSRMVECHRRVNPHDHATARTGQERTRRTTPPRSAIGIGEVCVRTYLLRMQVQVFSPEFQITLAASKQVITRLVLSILLETFPVIPTRLFRCLERCGPHTIR
jgi:hypothetical protein